MTLWRQLFGCELQSRELIQQLTLETKHRRSLSWVTLTIQPWRITTAVVTDPCMSTHTLGQCHMNVWAGQESNPSYIALKMNIHGFHLCEYTLRRWKAM